MRRKFVVCHFVILILPNNIRTIVTKARSFHAHFCYLHMIMYFSNKRRYDYEEKKDEREQNNTDPVEN